MGQTATNWASFRGAKMVCLIKKFSEELQETRCEDTSLSECVPELLKNLQYLEILNPNPQWTLHYQMGFLGRKIVPYEVIWGSPRRSIIGVVILQFLSIKTVFIHQSSYTAVFIHQS